MKNTRRFISAVMALAMVSAIAPMSAFAINQNDVASGNNTGTMTATYDVTAKYTVTIPAGVTLDSTNAVSKNIEASNVVLESGQKIKVTLTEASNTASGSSFSAKTEKKDSTATYTIGKGTADSSISVGDVVAEFIENGTQSLTFSKAEGATHAGTHTETLTFGISVEDAAYTPQTYNTLSSGDVLKPGDTVDSNTNYDFLDLGASLNKYYTWTLLRADVTAGEERWPTVTEKDDGAYYVIKGVDRDNGDSFYMVQQNPEGNLEGMIFSVTATSDGVVLTQSGSSWTMAVHEP